MMRPTCFCVDESPSYLSTFNSLRRTLFLLGAAAIAWGASAAAAAEPAGAAWVKSATPGPFELRLVGKTDEVSIPLTYAKFISPENVELRIVDVRFGQRHSPSLKSAVQVKSKQNAPNGPAFAEFTFTTADYAAAGNYGIRIRAIHPPVATSDETPLVADLDLEFVVPEATLQAPDLVVVELEQFCPWAAGVPANGADVLTLRELSGRARLDPVVVISDSLRAEGGGLTGGHLEFDANLAVAAGGESALSFRTKGDFPLGKSTGQIAIRAPQLSKPSAVNVEVRQRLHPMWLGIAATFGLGGGFVVRTWLRRRIERGEVETSGGALWRRLRRAIEANPDDAFRAKVHDLANELEQSLGASGTSTDAIAESVKNVAEKFVSASHELDELRRRMSDEAAKWRRLVALAPQLPREAKQLVEQHAQAVQEIEQAVRDDRPSVAETCATRLIDVPESFVSAAIAWRNVLSTELHEVRDTTLPAPNQLRWAEQMDRFLTQLEALAFNPKDLVGTSLHIVSFRRLFDSALRYLAARAGEALRHEARNVCELLADLPVSLPAKVRDLPVKAAEIAALFEAELSDDEASRLAEWRGLLSENGAIENAFRGAILEQVDGTNRELAEQVAGEFGERRYTAAARLIAAARRSAKSIRRRGARPDEETEPDAEVAASADTSLFANELVPGWMRNRRPGGLGDDAGIAPAILPRATDVPFDVWERRASRELLLNRVTQWGLIALLVIMFAYSLFGAKFVGTWNELFLIFMWGFTSDVSLDTLVNLSKGLPKR